MPGYERTEEHRRKMSKILKDRYSHTEFPTKGSRNGSWKGDRAGKVAIHHWVKKRKSKTGICSHCGEKRYTEWANVDHKYRRVLDDYIELCKPCHMRFDGHPFMRD